MNSIELNLFAGRVTSVCSEMGLVLQRTSFSPNIKDRLDFSCALFSAAGELYAQAAHIPVHLGSMAYAMTAIVNSQQWQPGDMLILNDPYLGGTHLPDVTVVAPVFDVTNQHELVGFVANRAHHANIGCDVPGSMPISTSLEEEGIIIAPQLLIKQGQLQLQTLKTLFGTTVRGLEGDLAAQVGANEVGLKRLQQLISRVGINYYQQGMLALNDYAARLAEDALSSLRPGSYGFTDYLDDDGCGTTNIPLTVLMTVSEKAIELDFSQCPDQVRGNLNCPVSVVAAAVYYAFRCLMPPQTPSCSGAFKALKIVSRKGSLVDACYPAAVAAGNVETSSRLVDVIFGALAQALPDRIPAASQGTMNNIALGQLETADRPRWDYYETVAGGSGAGPNFGGLDARHSHMTNTLNTPVESIETHYPLRVCRYAIRENSGGEGKHRGGHGVIKEYQFLAPACMSIISERRNYSPWGLQGGGYGKAGENRLNGKLIPAKCSLEVKPGDRLLIQTPGGGGFGAVKKSRADIAGEAM